MAIKLTATLVEPFDYISLRDEALDPEHEDFEEEYKRYKEGTIPAPPLKEGVEPSTFTLRPISGNAELSAKLDGVLEADGRSMWALAAGSLAITGWRNIEDENGKPLKFKQVRVQGFMSLTKQLQDKLGKELLSELGMVALTHKNPNAV